MEITAERKGGWCLFNFGSGIRLRFELIIPDKYNAYVSSSGGDIQLKDLTGNIELKTSGGDVAVRNTNGELKVGTSGGDISLDNNSGDITLKTSGGDIQTHSFSGNIYASSSGGDVTLQGSDGTVEASSSGGEVTLDYTGDNKGIKLTSSGGDIKLKLPADFNAHAELYTSGGDIECAFKGNNAEKISSSKYEADFNNGGNTVYAKTSGGDIVVKKR